MAGAPHISSTPAQPVQELLSHTGDDFPILRQVVGASLIAREAEQMPTTADGDGDLPSASTRTRMSWAQLLKRVFAIDLTTCPQCGGPLTILAAIGDPTVIAKILAHLGLPTRAPPKTPARLDAFRQTA